MALPDRAASVLPVLLNQKGLSSGQIIFVTHSLGGLVVEQVLRQAEQEATIHPNILEFLRRVKKIAFVGTPHRGSDQASLAKLFRILTRPRESLSGLARNDPHLRELNIWFRRFSEQNDLRFLVLQETIRTGFFGQIVKFDSSDPGLPPSKTKMIPLDEDHLSIVKPKDREADTYRHLYDFVQTTSLSPDDNRAVAQQSILTSLNAASEPLVSWTRLLPDGTSLSRPELDQLFELTKSSNGSATALLGDPGSGKTALLAALACKLQASNIPFLGIKADALSATISNETDLAASLGLPGAPSSVLLDLSSVCPVVLIIDQLDALAGYVDLRTGRLNVLLNLVRKLGGRKNIHIILSARTFEFEHDTRLKSVRAEGLKLELPKWETIRDVLKANDIDATGWPSDAQELLRSPQALATYLKLSKRNSAPFSNYQAMLEELWQERIFNQPNGGELAKLAGLVADEMADKETLWIATAKFDSQREELNSLVSAGVLAHQGTSGTVGFSHQTVFEFALARSFSVREGRLSSYVLIRQASLFVRPKLWSALTYLRDVDRATYEAEIRTIWDNPDLRLHLRILLLEFLGSQGKPTEPEYLLFKSGLGSPARQSGLQAIIGSPGWFDRLKKTTVPEAMQNKLEAGVAARILERASVFAPDDVLDLIETWWLPDHNFDGHIWQVLQECRPWSARHLHVAKTVVLRSPIAAYAFENLLAMLGADQPNMAMLLAVTRLQGQLSKAAIEAEKRSKVPLPESHEDQVKWHIHNSPTSPLNDVVTQVDGWESLEALAKSEPIEFLKIFWPWFQDVFKLLRDFRRTGTEREFSLSQMLDFRFDEESGLNLPEPALLGALRNATEIVAANQSDKFLHWLASVEHEDAEPAQRLFAHSLSIQPERYAGRALEFLVSDKRRLNLGNLQDPSATTKRLVEAVSVFWTDNDLERFIEELRSYAPRPHPSYDASLRRYYYRHTDRLKLELLEELPATRLSSKILSHMQVERRRLGDVQRGSKVSGPQWIESPISPDNFAQASKLEIINAFRKVPDATEWDHPTARMKGGNIQLSRAFADFAREHPDKASNTIRDFERGVATRAAGYAVEAMAEKYNPPALLGVIHSLESRGFTGEEYRGSISHAIRRLIQRDVHIDNKTLDMLVGWLADSRRQSVQSHTTSLNAKDSADQEESPESTAEQSGDDKKTKEGSILWGIGGLSVLPGGNYPILDAIIQIFLQRKDYDGLIAVLNTHLDRFEHERVWRALCDPLRFVTPSQPAKLDQFFTKLFAKYPTLAGSYEAALLLAHLRWVIPNFMASVLASWENVKNSNAQQAFGELAALIWLTQTEIPWAGEMVQRTLACGSTDAQTGMTHSAVHVWAQTSKGELACDLLLKLLALNEREIWSAAIDLFRLVDEIPPNVPWIKYLREITTLLPSYKNIESTFIVQRLHSLLPDEAQLVGELTAALVANWKEELADIRTATATAGPELVDIALTLHRMGPETREMGTDLFENLIHLNAYSARETLNQIDNRFGAVPSIMRHRLPRRERRRKR